MDSESRIAMMKPLALQRSLQAVLGLLVAGGGAGSDSTPDADTSSPVEVAVPADADVAAPSDLNDTSTVDALVPDILPDRLAVADVRADVAPDIPPRIQDTPVIPDISDISISTDTWEETTTDCVADAWAELPTDTAPDVPPADIPPDENPQPTLVSRIVMAGDSWSTGLVYLTIAALEDLGFGSVTLSWETTAIAGSRAEEWVNNQGGKAEALVAALDVDPLAEVLPHDARC